MFRHICTYYYLLLLCLLVLEMMMRERYSAREVNLLLFPSQTHRWCSSPLSLVLAPVCYLLLAAAAKVLLPSATTNARIFMFIFVDADFLVFVFFLFLFLFFS